MARQKKKNESGDFELEKIALYKLCDLHEEIAHPMFCKLRRVVREYTVNGLKDLAACQMCLDELDSRVVASARHLRKRMARELFDVFGYTYDHEDVFRWVFPWVESLLTGYRETRTQAPLSSFPPVTIDLGIQTVESDIRKDIELAAFDAREEAKQEAVAVRGELADEEPELYAFRQPDKERDRWLLRFNGEKHEPLDDLKGWHYIRRLLDNPGTPIRVTDLRAVTEGVPTANVNYSAMTLEQLSLEHLSTDQLCDRPFDLQTKKQCKAHLHELQQHRVEAERTGDQAMLNEIDAESHKIEAYLKAGTGKNGRPRTTNARIERDRKAVSSCIKRAMAVLERELPALQKHLNASVSLGMFCKYSPKQTPDWNL